MGSRAQQAWDYTGTAARRGECECGCGEPEIVETTALARRLAAGRQAAGVLLVKARTAGPVSEDAAHLIWAWDRAEPGLDAAAHQRPGPPEPSKGWLEGWRERVAALPDPVAKKRGGWPRFRRSGRSG